MLSLQFDFAPELDHRVKTVVIVTVSAMTEIVAVAYFDVVTFFPRNQIKHCFSSSRSTVLIV